MKKFTLLFVLALAIQATALSQSCLPNGIIFKTQEEIDNFQTNYPNCTEIEGDVCIGDWEVPTNISNLDGLNVITSIGGYLDFCNNPSLTSFAGLENLTSIGGYLEVIWNHSLTSLTGFENLTSIWGEGLYIYENNGLTSLSGLDNLDAGTITDLWICRNPSLSTCNFQTICDYLVSPNGVVTIYNNASGCQNPSEIANACGFTMSCLPYGNYYFVTQIDIDNFQSNYPNCTDLKGDVIMGFCGYSANIYNLDGLNELTSIEGRLSIRTDGLKHLTGLNNVTFIGAELYITNNAELASLAGLNNLTSIGGFLWIMHNETLASLSSLTNVTSIGGDLWVTGNVALSSLTGLENIDANSITGSLYINSNSSLVTCEVQSICNYLASPGANINIFSNATGCNSQQEVEEACEAVNIPDMNRDFEFSIFPNPAKKDLYISSQSGVIIDKITIYNQIGQVVLRKTGIINKIDVSMLLQGMYIIEIVSNDSKFRAKLMIS